MNTESSSPVLGIVYLIVVMWTARRSSKPWVTLIWVVGGLAAVLALTMLAGLIFPHRDWVPLGVLISMFVSAMAGIEHMRGHRRPAPPKIKH